MFLSLVRPDRISSPMTRIAAVTIPACAAIRPSPLLQNFRVLPEPICAGAKRHSAPPASFAHRHRFAGPEAMRPDLAARYADERLPRYTSYPTAPQFHSAVNSDVHA